MAGRDLEKEMGVPEMLADHQREIDELYRASHEHHCPRWPEKCTGSPYCPLCGEASDAGRDRDFGIKQSMFFLALVAVAFGFSAFVIAAIS